MLLPAAGAEGAAAGAPGRPAGLYLGHGRVPAGLPLLWLGPRLPAGVERRPAAPPLLPAPSGPPPPWPAGVPKGQSPTLNSVLSTPRPLPGSGIHIILLSALSCTRLICSPSRVREKISQCNIIAKVSYQPQKTLNIRFSLILNKNMQSPLVVQQSKIAGPVDGAECSLSKSFHPAVLILTEVILLFRRRGRGLRAETSRFARSPSSTSLACSSFPPGT